MKEVDTIVKNMITSPKIKLPNISTSFTLRLGNNQILVKWYEERESHKNFGDALNPWLIEKLTGTVPVNSTKVFNLYNNPVYSCIGSILDYNATKNLTVWGSGFKYSHGPLKVKPEKILAVRGPLSRDLFLKQGVDCPEIYGDPALLLPKIYHPIVKKEYELGIIAHYLDKDKEGYHNFAQKIDEQVLLIDIEDSIEQVIKNILKCEKIASSSLHGLITADAYGIPTIQLKFSDKVSGGSFRFKDYMASVNRPYHDPLQITDYITIKQVFNLFEDYQIKIDLEALYDACPFIDGTEVEI